MKNGQVIAIVVSALAMGGALGFGIGNKQDAGKSGKGKQASAEMPTCSAGGDSHQSGLFELDGKVYSDADLPGDVEAKLYEIKHESHEKLENTLKEVAVRMALAKEKNVASDLKKIPPLQELLPQEKFTDEKIKAFFEANKSRVPPGTKYEDVKGQIEQYLAQAGVGETLRAKVTEFEKSNRLKMLVHEPVPPVVNLDLTGFPSQGAGNAKVTVVEASDYLCPHCQKMQPEVEAITKEFKDRIRFVQVNFALRPEGLSGQLAKGAYCAQKQGDEKFWKFHESAFKTNPETEPAKEKEEVLKLAQASGLNAQEFETCLTSPESKAFIESAVAKMSAVGVTGTPTFYVNNKKLSHHQPLRQAIEAALNESK